MGARTTVVRPRLTSLEDRTTPVAAVFNPATRHLSVTGTPGPDACELSVATGRILLKGEFTAGNPTVVTTDAISVSTGGRADTVTISLAGGPFGPAATPEGAGQSEIEIDVDTGDTPQDLLVLRGTAAADQFDLGVGRGIALVNLNGDRDGDIRMDGTNTRVGVYAGAGAAEFEGSDFNASDDDYLIF